MLDTDRATKKAFANVIKTDGFTADVSILKSVTNNSDDYHHLCDMDVDVSFLGDIMNNENFEGMSLCGLDPNRNQVFAAAYGDGEISHQVRRCSTKEYYTYTGSMRIAKKETERMKTEEVNRVMLEMPTAKTASISKYFDYMQYLLLHMQRMFQFNRFETAENRFYLYQGTQRARQEMANILINGGRKYNKSRRKNTKKNRKKRKKRRKRKQREGRATTTQSRPEKAKFWKPLEHHYNKNKLPVVAFGNGMFNKDSTRIKGCRTGVTGILYRQLKKKQRAGEALVVVVDEYKTSKV